MLVTAADTSHFLSLLAMVRSFRCHHKDERIRIVDLGMSPADQAQLADYLVSDPYTETQRFPYDHYPDWFDVKRAAGEYAWKPAIVAEAVELMDDNDDVLIWADAGCLIDGQLTRVREHARLWGVYASLTCGALSEWTDPRTLDRLSLPMAMRNVRMRAATLLAFCRTNKNAACLVKEWRDCCTIRECVAPPGATKRPYMFQNQKRKGHRQDQSVFTALLVLDGLYDRLPVSEHRGDPCRWNWRAHCDCDRRPRNF